MKNNSPRVPRAILIADSSIEDLDILLDGIDEGVMPWVVQPGENAISIIAEALRMPDLKTLHLLAHGAPGQIQLGGRTWSADDFHPHFDASATRDLDIAFWSCNTGAGALGQHFVQTVATATGARVTAAQGLVGNVSEGGSWQGAGAVHAPFSAQAQSQFPHTLPSGVVMDSTANLQAQMVSLIADYSQILQVMSTDFFPSTLTYAVNGTEGASLRQLLGLFASNAPMNIVLTGSLAQLQAVYDSGLGNLDFVNGMVPVSVTPSDVSVRDFLHQQTLATEFGNVFVPSATVVDTAASVEAFFTDMLASAATVPGFSITFTDTTQTALPILINGMDGAALATLFGSVIQPNSHVVIVLSGTAATLKQDFDAGLGIVSSAGVGISATNVKAADVRVLISEYGVALAPIPVTDLVSNVQANLADLLANSGSISRIYLSGPGTLTYTVNGTDGRALQTLLNKLTPDPDQHLALVGTATDLLVAFHAGLTGLGSLAGFASVSVTTVGVVSASDASELATDYGSLLHASAMSGAVTISANDLGQLLPELLANLSQVSSVTLNDTSSGSMFVVLDGSEGAALNAALFGTIIPNRHVTLWISGSTAALKADYSAGLVDLSTLGGYAGINVSVSDATIGAADAVTLVSEYGSTLHALNVVDTAAHVGSNLASLLPAVGPQISHITLTNTRPTTLSYTVTGTDSALLSMLHGSLVPNANVTLALSGSMADLTHDYVDGLNWLDSWTGFAAIQITPTGNLSVNDLLTLRADFGNMLNGLHIQDSVANIQAHFADLVAVGGQLNGLMLTDASTATLNYTVTGTDGAALIGLLTHTLTNPNVALVLTGTAANLDADAVDGLGSVLDALSKFPPLASISVVVSEHVSVADAGALGAAYGAQLAPLTVADTADHLATLSGGVWIIDPAVQAASSVIIQGTMADDELAALQAAHVNLVLDTPGLSTPNVFIIETATTPALTISSGMVAEVIDSASASGHTFHIATGGKLWLSGSDGANNIVFDSYKANQLSVSHSGTTVIFTDTLTSQQVAAIATDAVHAPSQTITYSDGSHVALTLVGSTLALDGTAISTIATIH